MKFNHSVLKEEKGFLIISFIDTISHAIQYYFAVILCFLCNYFEYKYEICVAGLFWFQADT